MKGSQIDPLRPCPQEKLSSKSPALLGLNANPTKWLNTLKQFAGITVFRFNCLSVFSVFDHFMGLTFKGLRNRINKNSEYQPIQTIHFF